MPLRGAHAAKNFYDKRLNVKMLNRPLVDDYDERRRFLVLFRPCAPSATAQEAVLCKTPFRRPTTTSRAESFSPATGCSVITRHYAAMLPGTEWLPPVCHRSSRLSQQRRSTTPDYIAFLPFMLLLLPHRSTVLFMVASFLLRCRHVDVYISLYRRSRAARFIEKERWSSSSRHYR